MKSTHDTQPLLFVHSLTPGTSEREVNLQRSLIRSYASRLSHNAKPRRVSAKSYRHNNSSSLPRKTLLSRKKNAKASVTHHDRTHSSENRICMSQISNYTAGDLIMYSCPSWTPIIYDRGIHWQEERSLQFFVANTAKNWAGWQDANLWRTSVPQISTVHTWLRHILAALGAYHESVHVSSYDTDRSLDLKILSLSQGQKALNLFTEASVTLPASIRLLGYMALAALSFFYQPSVHLQLVLAQHDYEKQLDRSCANARNDLSIPQKDWQFIEQYLKPCLERQRSKYTQGGDMLWALRNAPSSVFHVRYDICIPESWPSLSRARDALEDILKHIAFEIKTGTRKSSFELLNTDPTIHAWMASLEGFARLPNLSTRDRLSIKILRVTAKILTIAIMMINIDNEMEFDRFTPVYRELADVFIAACTFQRSCDMLRGNVKFGIDNSLMMLCADVTMHFCRCPSIREDLINAFRSTDRIEGIDRAGAWAEVCDLTRTVEEQGIAPPPVHCYEIPRENRRRFVRFSSFSRTGLIRLDFLRYPYASTDFKGDLIEEYWMCNTGFTCMSDHPPDSHDRTTPPEITFGQGSISILRPGSSTERYTITNPKFYFNIPCL